MIRTDRHGMTPKAYLFAAILLIAFVLSFPTGCTHTEITLPGGAHYSRTSLLSNQTAALIDVRTGGPTPGATIKGMNINQGEAAAQALEKAAAALRSVP